MAIGAIQGGAANPMATLAAAAKVTSFDPRDTNQDGVVSPAEELAWLLTHTNKPVPNTPTPGDPTLAQYGASGTITALAGMVGSTLNLQA